MEKEKQLDFNDFKDKLGAWADMFKPFIESEEMWNIYQKIKEDAKTERIVPSSDNTFRAFLTTNPKDLRVIFHLQDPYPKLYKNKTEQATGIAMDCSNSPDKKIQPSLEKWYDAIDAELKAKVNRTPNLEYLHQQGVMLLNTDLTCKVNKTGSHDKLWMPFIKYFLEDVLGTYNNIIHVICGKPSLRIEGHINPFCKIFKLEHPVAAAYTSRDWNSNGIFIKINNILKDNNLNEIQWNVDDWEAPF